MRAWALFCDLGIKTRETTTELSFRLSVAFDRELCTQTYNAPHRPAPLAED